MAWWRAHDEAVDDPKLQRLSGEMFKAWFNLVCLASRNGGVLPSMADISFRLRKSERECQRVLDSLISAKLFDEREHGVEPHNWNGRQYKSDVSTGRVRSFRKRQKERSTKPDETVSRNAPEQSRGKDNPLQGLSVTVEPPSPVAARGGLEAPTHDTASVLANLGTLKRVVQ